jgi:hypothetical protein
MPRQSERSTVEKIPPTDPQVLAHQEAAERPFLKEMRFEPELAQRICERSEQMMAETSRRVCFLDVERSIHDARVST